MLSPCCQFLICSLWKRSSNRISFCSSQHAPPSPSSYIGQAAQRKRKMDRTAWRESNILKNHTQQQVIQVMDHYGCDIKIQYTSPKKTAKSLWQSWTHFRISIRFPNVSILRQVLVQLISFFDQKGANITNIWTQGSLSHLFHPIRAIDHIPRSELPDRFWQNFHYDTPPFGFFLLTIPSKQHHSFWLGFKSLPQSTIGVDKAYSGNGNWSFHMMVLCDVVF